MSTNYPVSPSANGSRGRHGHARPSHGPSKHDQQDISSVHFEGFRNSSQMNVNAPGKSHHRQPSYTPPHISHPGDDLLGGF